MVLATPTLAFVLAAAKVQGIATTPSVDAVSATVAVDSVTIRGAYKGVGSVIALDGIWREARIVVLGNPVHGEELPSGVQPSSFHVQRPHQAVLARVRRAPVGVELSAKRVGGYALSGPALIVGILVAQEAPADHQLLTHHRHRLRRTHSVAHPTPLAASSLVQLGQEVAASRRQVELPTPVNHLVAERILSCSGYPRGVMDPLGAQLDQCLGRLAVYRVAHARRPDRLAVELEVAVCRLVVAFV